MTSAGGVQSVPDSSAASPVIVCIVVRAKLEVSVVGGRRETTTAMRGDQT